MTSQQKEGEDEGLHCSGSFGQPQGTVPRCSSSFYTIEDDDIIKNMEQNQGL